MAGCRREEQPRHTAADGAPDLTRLFGELVRLETELCGAVERRLRADHGLPLPHFEFMRVIARTPDCRVQDIATRSAFSSTAPASGGSRNVPDRDPSSSNRQVSRRRTRASASPPR